MFIVLFICGIDCNCSELRTRRVRGRELSEIGKIMINNDAPGFINAGVTQRVMAKLVGSNPSTIHKNITALSMKPLPSNTSKNLRYPIPEVRRLLSGMFTEKRKVTKPVLSFYNFKGGVGKTSLCFQIASYLALLGYNVLAVDADPQGHLSTSFGYDGSKDLYTLYDVMSENVSINDTLCNVFEGLDLVPANLSLTRIETLLNDMPRREERVKIALGSIMNNYDFVVFDTNPTISHLNKNIISFSNLINIVVETQAYALNGLKILMADLQGFYKKMQMQVPEYLLIPNKYEDRASNSVEAMSALVEYYSKYIKPNFAVRKSEDFNTSAKNSSPLPLFARTNSIALEDIAEISLYLIDKVTEKVM